MRFLVILATLFVVSLSQAQIVFAPSVHYSTAKVKTNAGTAEGKDTIFDLKLAYLHSSGLYLGGMYSSLKFTDDSGYSAGPTIGYSHYSGFYALFTYNIISEYKQNGGAKLTEGMGTQIDVGWVFPLASMFSIGPQVTYRSLTYKKADGAATDITYSRLDPQISLWFQF